MSSSYIWISLLLLIAGVAGLVWRIQEKDTVKVHSPASANCAAYRDTSGHCGIWKDNMCWLGKVSTDGTTCKKSADNVALAFLGVAGVGLLGFIISVFAHARSGKTTVVKRTA